MDYWVLDLADVEQARVLQELIFLGDEEPGRNFVEVMFNDKDFQVPAGWLKQVPRAGIISLHYCREKDTCRRIEASFSGQWPPMYHERHGLEWVARQRLKTIKEKVVLSSSSSSSSLITPCPSATRPLPCPRLTPERPASTAWWAVCGLRERTAAHSCAHTSVLLRARRQRRQRNVCACGCVPFVACVCAGCRS